MNEVILKAIDELRTQHFFIDDFNRSYQWKKGQIPALLNDILEFCNKENKLENEFCYMGSLILRHRNNKWEIVDGLQRLTIILLIMKYLNGRYSKKFKRKVFTLEYKIGIPRYLIPFCFNSKADNKVFNKSHNEIRTWFNEQNSRVTEIESAFFFKVKFLCCEINETIDDRDAGKFIESKIDGLGICLGSHTKVIN